MVPQLILILKLFSFEWGIACICKFSNLADGRVTFYFHLQCQHKKLHTLETSILYTTAYQSFYATPKLQLRYCRLSCFVPYLFEEAIETGFVMYSVTVARYTHTVVLQNSNYIIPELLQRNAFKGIVWMQEGTPSYLFAGSWKFILTVSSPFPFLWLPRHHDLTPMDLWFWWYLKSTELICKLCCIWKSLLNVRSQTFPCYLMLY